VGVSAAALARGATLAEGVRRAVTAAALSCTRVGSQNSLPDAQETDAALVRLAAH
jgi:ribokinase